MTDADPDDVLPGEDPVSPSADLDCRVAVEERQIAKNDGHWGILPEQGSNAGLGLLRVEFVPLEVYRHPP